MLTLRLLGGLSLGTENDQPVGRAAQKRRLALLAVLALRPGLAVTRDKLLALLWPEASTDDGRHRLSAALYDLRRALGDDVLIARGDDVMVASGAIHCDVLEFEAAIATGDFEAAVHLYRGPFLDGVHLDRAPEFEDWVEQRRAQLARASFRALEEWANICAGRGEFAAAVDAWQRLAAADPLNDRFALGVMRSLDMAGNRAGALKYGAFHEQRLRTELGVEPNQSLREFVSELRSAPLPLPDADSSHPVLPGPVPARALPFSAVPLPPAGGAPNDVPVRFRAWYAGAALLALLLAPFALRNMFAQPENGPGASAVALAAFQEGTGHLEGGRFDQAVAALERATRLDSGYAPAWMELARATLWADHPGDRISARIQQALSRRDQLDDEHRMLLDGFIAWRQGEWHKAEAIYRRALTANPSSITARYELGDVLFHYNAPQGRSISEARFEFERVLEHQPKHYGALWHLALLDARERRTTEVRRLAGRMLAVGPDSIRALEVQALSAAASRDAGALDLLVERLQDADESLLFGIGWRMAIFGSNLEAARRVYTLLTTSRRSPFARALGHSQLFFVALGRGNVSEADEHLRALLAMPDAGVPADWLRVLAALSPAGPLHTGDLKKLRDSLGTVESAVLEAMPVFRGASVLTSLGAASALLGDSARARRVVERLDAWAAAVPDSLRFFDGTAGRAATLRALLARQAGKPEEVLQWTAHSFSYRWFASALSDPFTGYGLPKFLRAEALQALGRLDEAEMWYASIGQHDPSDLVFLGAALEQRARIARARGDQPAARKIQAHLDAMRSTTP